MWKLAPYAFGVSVGQPSALGPHEIAIGLQGTKILSPIGVDLFVQLSHGLHCETPLAIQMHIRSAGGAVRAFYQLDLRAPGALGGRAARPINSESKSLPHFPTAAGRVSRDRRG